MVKLEQSLEQCLEKRMDGSCRSHPPVEDQLLLWTGKTYDPTTHQIKSRLTPAYNLTLKRGLCGGGGANLYVTPSTSPKAFPLLSGAWSIMIEFTTDDLVAGTQFLHYRAGAGDLRFLFSIASGRLAVRMGLTAQTNIDDAGDISANTHYIIASTGITVAGAGTAVTYIWKNGVRKKMADYAYTGLTEIAGSCSFGTGSNSFLGCWHKVGVWESAQDSSTLTDFNSQAIMAVVFQTRAIDLAENYTFTVDTLDYTQRTNNCFYLSEQGFAVKSGAIYPKLLSGTGYAGLVGEPDAVYQGLIATKGQPEIGTKQYLGTEYDFGDAAAITDAGVSWDEWDGEDDNSDTVGTAETDLDTDYYNAITASLMTCTSIAGYAGTSNVSKRLFFKVADRVMKDDGSFLAESGRVQEIMVYKRDLTEAEILRVQKYCREVTE